eukprot:3059952-Amphidinium_carterae.1
MHYSSVSDHRDEARVEIKTRLVVDLGRSGANSRATVPERMALPRPSDVLDSARALFERRGELQAD